jgi:hypothetical protein
MFIVHVFHVFSWFELWNYAHVNLCGSSCLHMFGVLHGAKAEGESYPLTALHSRPHQVGPHGIILHKRSLLN